MTNSGNRESLLMVYDATSGDIVHVHQSVSSAEGVHPDDRELERRALQLASEAGHNVQRLAVLHVDPATVQRMVEYKVDTKNRSLI